MPTKKKSFNIKVIFLMFAFKELTT